MTPLKQCPRCKKPSPIDANVCGTCGHMFKTKFVATSPTTSVPVSPNASAPNTSAPSQPYTGAQPPYAGGQQPPYPGGQQMPPYAGGQPPYQGQPQFQGQPPFPGQPQYGMGQPYAMPRKKRKWWLWALVAFMLVVTIRASSWGEKTFGSGLKMTWTKIEGSEWIGYLENFGKEPKELYIRAFNLGDQPMFSAKRVAMRGSELISVEATGIRESAHLTLAPGDVWAVMVPSGSVIRGVEVLKSGERVDINIVNKAEPSYRPNIPMETLPTPQ